MKRLALAVALGAGAGSAALAADFPQPVPVPAQSICNPVASWTEWSGAVCIKYLCPGFDVQIRCAPAPPLSFGPRGGYYTK
jgi:opacity protein-like surface antigen